MIKGIEQHHLELLLAAYNFFGVGVASEVPVTPPAVQQAIDLIQNIASGYMARRISTRPPGKGPPTAEEDLVERMRMHTQAVRNWGYFSHVEEVINSIYGSDSEILIEKFGFTTNDLIVVARIFLEHSSKVIGDRFQLLRKVAKGRRGKDIIQRYFRFRDDLVGTPKSMIEALGENPERETALYSVMAHCDLMYAELLSLSVEEISDQTGIPCERVQSLLEHFTLKVDRNAQFDIDKFYLDNPVWSRPIIRNGDRYIAPIPMMFFSHSHRIFWELWQAVGQGESISKRRSKFLETELERLVLEAFPSGSVTSSVPWEWEGRTYETDLILSLDRFVVIFEAKSQHLSESALRGAPSRLKRHVRELIDEPSLQSQRLSTVIQTAVVGDKAAEEVCTKIGLDVDGSTKVIRISIALEDLSPIVGFENQLREIGWLSSGPSAPCISILDLRCIFEILSEEYFKLHYLFERQFTNRFEEMLGDEIDNLGVYLDNQFNFSVPDGIGTVILSGMSDSVDRFYLLDEYIDVKKPSPKVHKFTKKLLEKIYERRRTGWSLFACSVLSMGSWAEVKKLERARKA